jgi:hypothetical protein
MLSIYGIEKRINPISLTTSIIIPCHIKHFPFLEELLIAYAHQTVIPHEVVVFISAINEMSPRAIDHLEAIKKTHWPYRLIVITSKKPVSAGQSRNICCSAAKKDILICQDADDIPHPQRVEIIKWFFESYDVEHLMHGFIESHNKNEFLPINRNDIKYDSLAQYTLIHDIANGPVSIHRKVFEKMKWANEFIHSEDVFFNQKAYELSFKTVIIFEKLYLYRRGIKKDPL